MPFYFNCYTILFVDFLTRVNLFHRNWDTQVSIGVGMYVIYRDNIYYFRIY